MLTVALRRTLARFFLLRDRVWPLWDNGCLCVGCAEIRLRRRLAPDDFPQLPLNDSRPWDSPRLRSRKGSGRLSEARYEAAVLYVLDEAWSVEDAAVEWDVERELLRLWVDNALVNMSFLAEEGGCDGD